MAIHSDLSVNSDMQCFCILYCSPGNHILNKMGLSVLGSTVKSGCYKAPDPAKACKDNYHFRRMLRRFASHVTRGEELTAHELVGLKKLGGDCASYLNMKAHHCPSYTQVLSTLTEIVMRSGMPKVSIPGWILHFHKKTSLSHLVCLLPCTPDVKRVSLLLLML